MIVIGLLTAPGARDTTSPTAAGESAVEPATLVREPEAQQVQASLLVAAYERNDGNLRPRVGRVVHVIGRLRHFPSTPSTIAAPTPGNATGGRSRHRARHCGAPARPLWCAPRRPCTRRDRGVRAGARPRTRSRGAGTRQGTRAEARTSEGTRLSSDAPAGLTVRQAAALWGVSKSTAARRLATGSCPVGQTCLDTRQVSPSVSAGVLNVWIERGTMNRSSRRFPTRR